MTVRKGDGDQEMVEVCPECDSSQLVINSTPSMNGPEHQGKKYRCKGCSETFDKPQHRRREGSGSCISSAHALSLVDADPDLDIRAAAEQTERRVGR